MQIFVPTHPIEGELVICPKIEGFFDCEILHPNGTKSKPWDKPQKNTISKTYLNNLFSGSFAGPSNTQATTMTNLLFHSASTLVVGTSNLSIAASDILYTQASAEGGGLVGRPFMSSSTKAGSGNVADVDSTTGNAILTGNWQFAAATSAMTIREAAINSGTNGLSWQWQGSLVSNRIWNRVVLPTPVSLNVGDVLTMSYTLVIPTLAVTAQTVTLAAQNGMNISGQLKLIGTKANILGGSVTGAGVHTVVNAAQTAGTGGGGAIFPSVAAGGLTTATTFPTVFTNTTGMNTNVSSSQAWNTYVTDSFTRTYETVWNTAFATTNFRSANLYLGTGTYGYQLLLDAQQTKELNKALTIGWTFGVQT